MSIIIRKSKNKIAILKDGYKEIESFTGKTAQAQADAWLAKRGMEHVTRETVLFESRAQTVSWITNAGDDSEPKTLCGESLLHLTDDIGRDIVCTGEEAQLLAVGILEQFLPDCAPLKTIRAILKQKDIKP